jgi:hypothetical protein
MRKLKVRSDQLIVQILNCNWVAESDLARKLECRRHEVYDKVLKIADEHQLLSMRIETGEHDAHIILFPPTKTSQILNFIAKLPKPKGF